jgi:hypothetical protein
LYHCGINSINIDLQFKTREMDDDDDERFKIDEVKNTPTHTTRSTSFPWLAAVLSAFVVTSTGYRTWRAGVGDESEMPYY